jgi:hypothetical protein
MTTCDVVAERVALGEPLADAAEHAERCPKCRRLVALPTDLGGVVHREADPGLGFTARMTAGAQHRVVVRRRRRIVGGLAVAVAAMSAGVFLVTREPASQTLAETPSTHEPQPATNSNHDTNDHDPWQAHDGEIDDDVAALVRLADTHRASHASAHWKRIEKPLEPYRSLLQGVEP